MTYCVLPDQRRVMVIAPHPDDEAIGCGGTICKHLDRKDMVSVLYITDGQIKESFPGERKREARELMGYLGISGFDFIGLRDQDIEITREVIETIRSKLVNTDLVYLPHFHDGHIDHMRTNLLFAEALRGLDKDINVLCYEIWSPLRADTVINISSYADEKRKMIGFYKSQLKDTDFIKLIECLNEYRAMTCAQADNQYIAAVLRDSKFLLGRGRGLVLPWGMIEAFKAFTKESYLRYADDAAKGMA